MRGSAGDGSAAAEDAISRHRGEAALAHEGFVRLDDRLRASLLAFLRSRTRTRGRYWN
jgi:CxxC motif-containing protein (DUF1111 family)